MKAETEKKLEKLRTDIAKFESLLIFYSGGTDSTLLAAIAKEQLKNRTEAVLFKSAAFPQKLLAEACNCASVIGIKLHLTDFFIFENPILVNNPENRCYVCKKNMISQALALACERGISAVADGSQTDDLKTYRPGRQALKEGGVYSPLEKAMLNKREIREISSAMKLPNWNQPSSSCLMTRFPHRERLTAENIKKIEVAEDFLKDLGFKYFRVKHHGDIVRLSLGAEETVCAFGQYRDKIIIFFKSLNYMYVTVDIEERDE
ncbi:MAG: ATP-dependent sacrificial sulfur transferase LarE [Deferribacteraceae bacterium]|jgi:uncharacterized protein|nr:ATP-dependent sacrificial sulfur transferase LarE [Deferribacteraceae bacterium]